MRREAKPGNFFAQAPAKGRALLCRVVRAEAPPGSGKRPAGAEEFDQTRAMC